MSVGRFTRMVTIARMENDDDHFLSLVNRIIFATIRDLQPTDVFVTRIDHWFDHKWLGFSGRSDLVGIHRLERLNIPPFMPRRVLSHHSYTLDEGAAVFRVASVPPLHRHQMSHQNLGRFIDRVSQSAAFIWLSGGTADADQGSVMVYNIRAEAQSGWYASFRRTDDWRIHKVKGLSTPELSSLIERGADAHSA